MHDVPFEDPSPSLLSHITTDSDHARTQYGLHDRSSNGRRRRYAKIRLQTASLLNVEFIGIGKAMSQWFISQGKKVSGQISQRGIS